MWSDQKWWNFVGWSEYEHLRRGKFCLVVTKVGSYQFWEYSEQNKACLAYANQSAQISPGRHCLWSEEITKMKKSHFFATFLIWSRQWNMKAFPIFNPKFWRLSQITRELFPDVFYCFVFLKAQVNGSHSTSYEKLNFQTLLNVFLTVLSCFLNVLTWGKHILQILLLGVAKFVLHFARSWNNVSSVGIETFPQVKNCFQ